MSLTKLWLTFKGITDWTFLDDYSDHCVSAEYATLIASRVKTAQNQSV